MKILKLLEKGCLPQELVFEEPEMLANVFAVQSPVSWTVDLYTFLNAAKRSVDDVPGSDPKSTKYVFIKLTKESVFNLVLAHANCTLFCAPNAQKRTGSQQGKKTIFLDV